MATDNAFCNCFHAGTQVEGAPLSKIQKMQIPHFSGKWWEIVENAALRRAIFWNSIVTTLSDLANFMKIWENATLYLKCNIL
ncbi:hypothetical protein RIR_jg15914.t1 [Rhizophagus irregularis DAOM 181602=DAOM 197198]|nr:hypothetical protein RIR_jg15914.t1 [Rhizophagus irregularis DAOM 181602=DAOM 197198]